MVFLVWYISASCQWASLQGNGRTSLWPLLSDLLLCWSICYVTTLSTVEIRRAHCWMSWDVEKGIACTFKLLCLPGTDRLTAHAMKPAPPSWLSCHKCRMLFFTERVRKGYWAWMYRLWIAIWKCQWAATVHFFDWGLSISLCFVSKEA